MIIGANKKCEYVIIVLNKNRGYVIIGTNKICEYVISIYSTTYRQGKGRIK